MPKVDLKRVVISDTKREQIMSVISQHHNSKKIFDDWGLSETLEKGKAISLLFYGVPGTGKTMMAQALADHLDMKLKTIGTADIESSEPGQAERNIRELFEVKEEPEEQNQDPYSPSLQSSYMLDQMRMAAYGNWMPTNANPYAQQSRPQPARPVVKKKILLFDECDSLLCDRGIVGVILAAQINELLIQLERFDGVVIFTTNRLGKLDPALERRISLKMEFEFPSEDERVLIWKSLLPKKMPIRGDVSIENLAKFPLAGGNIKNAILNAARRAAYENHKDVCSDFFVDAVSAELKSIKDFERTRDENRVPEQIFSRERGMVMKRG